MRGGSFMTMADYSRADCNDLWLLTEVEHIGKQPQVLEEAFTEQADADGFSQGYRTISSRLRGTWCFARSSSMSNRASAAVSWRW